MTKVLVILNPSSGKEEAENYVEELRAVLAKNYQEVSIKETSKDVGAEELAKAGADEGYDSVIAMGGDGTVHGAVNGLMKSSRHSSLGIIPLGTVNNFARSAGVPVDVSEAIGMLQNARLRNIDVAKVENQYFISSISAGPIPETVQHVDAELKAKLGPIAYVVKGVKALDEKKAYPFHIVFDGNELKQTYSLMLISLSNSVAGVENFFPDAAIDDGELYFLGLKESTVQEKLAIVPKMFQEDTNYTDNVDMFSFEEAYVAIEGEESPHMTMDGEVGPSFPVKIKVLPSALSIFVPETEN